MANPKFKPHRIVEKLTAGKGETEAVKLVGYFGSTSDGVIKLYPSLDDLSVCFHIREADILHVEDADPKVLPYGGSTIWVNAEAKIDRSVSQRISISARFLAGQIAAQMAGGPAVVYAMVQQPDQGQQQAAGLGTTWDGPGCQYSVWPCSVDHGACLKSNDMPCANTQQWWCPGQVLTAASCFTCAGYTCVAACYSAGCPPTVKWCPQTVHNTQCFCTAPPR